MSVRTLRALVACETSGIARRALEAQGFDTTSCDLEPAEDGSNHHIVCDVRDGILHKGWDLLAVMHPPCTRLCRSGRQWMSGPGKWTPPKRLPKGKTVESLRAEFELGVDIFTTCWNAPIERVAIENPVMNDLAKDRMPADLPKPQLVQPFWFGEPAYKETGWYLRGLPELVETSFPASSVIAKERVAVIIMSALGCKRTCSAEETKRDPTAKISFKFTCVLSEGGFLVPFDIKGKILFLKTQAKLESSLSSSSKDFGLG